MLTRPRLVLYGIFRIGDLPLPRGGISLPQSALPEPIDIFGRGREVDFLFFCSIVLI